MSTSDLRASVSQWTAKFDEAVSAKPEPGQFTREFYSADALVVPTGGTILVGHQHIEPWVHGAREVWNRLQSRVEHCRQEGGVVFSVGTFTGNVNLPHGPTDIAGNFLTVLEPQGSGYRMKAQSWSINPPGS
jgi:ketosteroid isomerase-like protein